MAVYLFPGQGAEVKAPADKLVTPSTEYIFETLDEFMSQKNILDFSNTRIFNPDNTLNLSSPEKQVANFASSLARASIEEESGKKCDICIGDSFGEISMIAYAEVSLRKKDPESLKLNYDLVYNRSKWTSECMPEGEKPTKDLSHLVMVVGADKSLIQEAVENVPEELGVAEISKVNDEKSIGIGGNIIAVKYAMDYLVDKGHPRRYCVAVPTDSPVHTRLMSKAKEKMATALDDFEFNKPKKRVIMMYSGKEETDPSRIKQCITGVMDTTADLNRSIISAVKLGFKDVVLTTVCRMYKKMIKRRKDVKAVD